MLIPVLGVAFVASSPSVAASAPCPSNFPLDHTSVLFGQGNATEFEAYVAAVGSNWGRGVAMYHGVDDMTFSPLNSQLAASAINAGAQYAVLGLTIGIGSVTGDPKRNYEMLLEVADGKYDGQLNALKTTLNALSQLKWLVRIGYECNLWFSANPQGVKGNQFDDAFFEPNTFAYKLAFERAAGILKSANIQTVFHPYRGGALNASNNAQMLYPGDAFVDHVAISAFNNDLCLPYAGQGPPSAKYPYCDPTKYRYDPNLSGMLTSMEQHQPTKPRLIAEASTQPPKLGVNTSAWVDSLTRLAELVSDHGIAQVTYVSTDWWVSQGKDFRLPQWGDSRLETNAAVLAWWKQCILKA